jgi:hypothetical protein
MEDFTRIGFTLFVHDYLQFTAAIVVQVAFLHQSTQFND